LTDPIESSRAGLFQVIEDQDQGLDENDRRQDPDAIENRGPSEDGVLRPQDIDVEGMQTDLQKWLGLKEYLPQVISQCLAV